MHELAAKVDEYARGMVGPLGSTLFEELGLYYIGPVDGHNVEDLICVLQEVASLNSMGPVLVHVLTEENREVENNPKSGVQGILPLISSSDVHFIFCAKFCRKFKDSRVDLQVGKLNQYTLVLYISSDAWPWFRGV